MDSCVYDREQREEIGREKERCREFVPSKRSSTIEKRERERVREKIEEQMNSEDSLHLSVQTTINSRARYRVASN